MILLLKLALAPALVVSSSLAGRRWGPLAAGTLAALPIVAGPILLITCLEHGTAFGAQAAAASLSGLVSLALFSLVLAWASAFVDWRVALPVSWIVCLVGDVFLSRMTLRPGWGLLLMLGSAWTVARLLPRQRSEPGHPVAVRWPWWDLPGRAAATAVLVVTVTTAAATMGPHGTGVLAPFPIATSVLAAFVLAQQGSSAVVHLLRGVVHGLLGFAVFCFLVAVLIEPVGVGAGFALATVSTVLVQLTVQRLR